MLMYGHPSKSTSGGNLILYLPTSDLLEVLQVWRTSMHKLLLQSPSQHEFNHREAPAFLITNGMLNRFSVPPYKAVNEVECVLQFKVELLTGSLELEYASEMHHA